MISELMTAMKSGARSNKYRVMLPMFDDLGKELDLLIQTASMPGKTLTPTEVIVKGRKYLMRGEMSLDGSWEMTFFNTEDMYARDYFIKWMNEVHNTNMDGQGLLGGVGIGGIGLSEASRAISGAIDAGANIAGNPLSLLGGIQATYQKDIKIEQLKSDGEPEMAVRLIGAFPTAVGAVEYSDATSEVSTTTVTFAYTDIQTESVQDSLIGAVFGDDVANLFN